MKPREELEAEFRKLARRADDRLRNIEAKSRREEFKGIKQYAYKKAMIELRKNFGGGKRFSSNIPKSNRKLQAKINAINRFLDSPTSVISKSVEINGIKQRIGILPMYKERAERMNEEWGTKFTWQTLAKYYENGLNERLEKEVGGSGEALNIVAEIQQNKRKIKNALKKTEDVYLEFDDEIAEKSINNLLSTEYGKDILKALL